MDVLEKVSAMAEEVARLKQVNQDLYSFVAKKIVSKWGVKGRVTETGRDETFRCSSAEYQRLDVTLVWNSVCCVEGL